MGHELIIFAILAAVILGAAAISIATVYMRRVKWVRYGPIFCDGIDGKTIYNLIEIARDAFLHHKCCPHEDLTLAINGLHIQVRKTKTFRPLNTLNPKIKVFGYQEKDTIVLGSTLGALAHELWHRVRFVQSGGNDANHNTFGGAVNDAIEEFLAAIEAR